MRRVQFAALAIIVAVAGAVASIGGATHNGTGFKTAKRPYLVPVDPGSGVEVDKIISTGDIVGGYQMSGIPDGLGAYRGKGHGDDDDDGRGKRSRGGTFTAVMNHELDRTFPLPPFNPGADARISRLVIDRKRRSVHEAEYLFTGNENYTRFCSATLALVFGRPYYFTGEETSTSGHFGSSIVLDPDSGMWRETRHFGILQHENVVPIKLKKWVFLTSDDDFRTGLPSYLYAYIADDFNKALRGTQGSLYVWRADNELVETGNATASKGEPIPGEFVPISQTQNVNGDTLKAEATRLNAFKFDRLEDIAVRPDVAGRTYIADTGKLTGPGATLKGRIYQFDINRHDPTRATLRMVLNGDPPDNDNIFNPDNLDASERVLMIQEDREAVFRTDWNYVLSWNFRPNSQPVRIARVDTDPNLPRGQWESSGIIDARHVIGRNWWLLDVQAHSRLENQPGPTLAPNSAQGEDGQLLAMYVPGSQGGGGGDDDDDDDDDDD